MTGAQHQTDRAQREDKLTDVQLTWVEKKIEYWIRFGKPAQELILDRRRRTISFKPGTIFAFVRWASNDHGTILSRIDIVRAINRGEAFQTLPFVRPGGDILLTAKGWPKVECVLQIIDATDVDPDHWRHIHNRIAAGVEPRSYTTTHHRAVLLRQRAGL
jgi:Protein of unknown function (DUF2840)